MVKSPLHPLKLVAGVLHSDDTSAPSTITPYAERDRDDRVLAGKKPMPENSQLASAKAVALFTYLNEFVQLRTKATREFSSYESILWFPSVPTSLRPF